MQRRQLLTGMLASLGATVGSAGLGASAAFASPLRVDPPPISIVGAWRLVTQGAPEAHHILTFSHDGIVTSFQAEAGDPIASVSSGAGHYRHMAPEKVRGVFVEDLYSRETRNYLGYVRVEFQVTVEGKTFVGTGHAQVFDPDGMQVAEAFPTLSATRITL